MKMLTVAAHTLGCKVNQCDTDAVLALLANIGYIIGKFSQAADIYIINTCTVTHTSDKKSRQIIRRARKQNPVAFVAVCGCMAKNDPTIANKLGVDFIFDARKPDDFIKEISKLYGESTTAPQDTALKKRTRSFVKIQDGCNRFCSYCIVPYVRGEPVSRPVAEILAEIDAHITNGVQEIVLTGIQVASYGEDLASENLPSLICKLSDIKSIKRLRLSSIEPYAITDEFIAAMANSAILCDHFHLSLQSGCDTTLARMNRRYTTSEYIVAIKRLRKLRPNAAFTTDIIVGFPGETDEEFYQSLAFVRKMGFSRIHVFEYSRRTGTPAADFENQVQDIIKTKRSKKMRNLAAALQQEFLLRQVGTTQSVLFESQTEGYWYGHTNNYCPVTVASDTNLTNTIRHIVITGHDGDGLIGKL